MIHEFPPLLKKGALALMIGIVVLALSLVVSSPISYLLTIGIGSFGLALGLLFYVIWFLKQLKEPG